MPESQMLHWLPVSVYEIPQDSLYGDEVLLATRTRGGWAFIVGRGEWNGDGNDAVLAFSDPEMRDINPLMFAYIPRPD